jgi:hypothetical protein
VRNEIFADRGVEIRPESLDIVADVAIRVSMRLWSGLGGLT